ncbi:hypothetical protein NDR87_13000 [Nocardia sp. CDC159]|uniref:Uncharacterized protein n=1 Tax=Nocardia pulmonis TaxID=2951408 RepID=A0A9X2E5M0_9NOCA|nr:MULTISPECIES: hypothetical protein [Nocardia]MCM6774659.1 hypothetical protein [Nocardia pulmonis]MCM6787276.1 hypothetical protein [Nocardia sp. CDC159]
MNEEYANDEVDRVFRQGIPIPSYEVIHLVEDAKGFIEMAIALYSSIASDETDPAEKARLEANRDRQSELLKSRRWMDIDEAKRIVQEYPEIIDRLREKDNWGSA